MSGSQTLCAAHYRTGIREEFTFGNGRLIARRRTRKQTDLVFGPGFCDLQCNGFAGVDYNNPALTVDSARESIRAMWRHGCTEVLPTVVSQAAERMEYALQVLAAACLDRAIAASAPGIHVEGPFLNPAEGARGAHPFSALRAPDVRLWQRLQKAAEGRIALLTLAPELKGALPFLQRLRGERVLPAIGHTLASAETIERAAVAGAMMSTHLGNGCPQVLPRHTNPIFAQAGCDALSASLIADGIHLPAEVLRSLARAKGASRTVLVTDAMAAAGAPPGRYTLGDLEMEVGADRVVRQPGQPNLAGSALTMDAAVGEYVRMTGASLAEAWDAASTLPRLLLARAGAVSSRPTRSGEIITRWQDSRLEVQAAFRGARVLWLGSRI